MGEEIAFSLTSNVHGRGSIETYSWPLSVNPVPLPVKRSVSYLIGEFGRKEGHSWLSPLCFADHRLSHGLTLMHYKACLYIKAGLCTAQLQAASDLVAKCVQSKRDESIGLYGPDRISKFYE